MAERGASLSTGTGIQRGDSAIDLSRGVITWVAPPVYEPVTVPNPINAPVPAVIANAYPTAQQPAQTGFSLTGGIDLFGLHIPVWMLLAGAAFFIFKGK